MTAGREDPLLGTLVDAAARLAAEPVLGPLCAQLLDELRALRQSCLELAPRDRTPLAGPVSFRLAERYGVLLAAASCLGVWLHNPDHPGAFLRGTGWLAAALARLTARLGCPPVPGADAAHPEVFAELIERHQDGRGFDLVGLQLA